MAGERRLYLSACLVVVGCALLGGWFGGPSRAASATADADIENSLRLFTKVLNAVETNYADPVNEDKAIYNGAIPGMLRTLDPHSNFFDPKTFSLLREEQQGRYYGVGMTVGPRSGKTCDFRSGRTILQRTIERSQMQKLLASGKTDLLQFVSARTRRPFAAYLVRQPDGKIGFEFEKRAAKTDAPKPAAKRRAAGK